MNGTGVYATNQKEIHDALKEKWGWKCERCGSPNDRESGHVLTVHHLDGNKSNNAEWNLACLCQKCHLSIQGRVFMPQSYMFEHTDWFKAHLQGYLNSIL